LCSGGNGDEIERIVRTIVTATAARHLRCVKKNAHGAAQLPLHTYPRETTNSDGFPFLTFRNHAC